jgi:hypothetical protein
MRLNKKVVNCKLAAIAMAIVLTYTLLGSHMVLSKENDDSHGFDVHEWGVFLKGYECNGTSVLTESESTLHVRKPVIYFHSQENISNIVVNINNIRNASVIPNATVETDGISWNVSIVNNSIILPNGTTYPYLFYEGDILCSPTINANIDTSDGNVTFYIKNIADYPISNIYFIYGYPIGEPPYDFMSPRGLTYVYIEQLEKNEERSLTSTLALNLSYNVSDMLSQLMKKGLTSEESQELIDYWETFWFYPTNIGNYSRVLYTIPQSVYDQLLPLTITSSPDVTKRIGIFTITDIPINSGQDEETVDTENGTDVPGFELILAICVITVMIAYKRLILNSR